MPNVRYEKAMRQRAIDEKKFLVTIDVNGRPIKDDSCCIQRVADVSMAKEIYNFALKICGAKREAGDV